MHHRADGTAKAENVASSENKDGYTIIKNAIIDDLSTPVPENAQ